MSDGGQQQQQQGGGEGGGQQAVSDYTPFYAQLSDDNKTVFAARKFDAVKTSANDLLDTIRNQDKLIGSNNLPAPRLDDDKALSEWPGFKALGVPDKAEDYQLKRPDKLPDGMQWDDNREKLAREAMLRGHVPAKFAQGVFDALVNDEITRHGAAAGHLAEAKTAMDAELTRDWGGEKDKNIAAAKDAARALAEKAKLNIEPGAIADHFSALYGDANAIKLLHYLSTALGEDTISGGGGGGALNPGTPAGAQAEIARLETDPGFLTALNDASHEGHKAAVERRNALYKTASSGKS